MTLLYFIKCFISMGLSWALYRIVLSDRKSFLFSRFYLLLSLVGLALIPFYTYPAEVAPVVESFAPSIESLLSSNGVLEPEVIVPTTTETLTSTNTKSFNFMWIIYGISMILLFRVLFNVVSLSWLAKKNFYHHKGGINVVSYNADNTPFSFFNNLFVSEEDIKNGLPEAIVLHEECHIKHVHSVDRLISELILILQWWNPFAHLLMRDLRDNHEYTADAYAISNTQQSESYVNCLLERSISVRSYGSLQIGFGQSPIMKRLRMLKSKADGLSISQAAPLFIIMLLLIMSCVGSVGETINLENSYVDVTYVKSQYGSSAYPTELVERMKGRSFSGIPEYRTPAKVLFDKIQSASNYRVVINGKRMGEKGRKRLTRNSIKAYSVTESKGPRDRATNEQVYFVSLFTQDGYFKRVERLINLQDDKNDALLKALRSDDILWVSLSKYGKSGGAPDDQLPVRKKITRDHLDKYRYGGTDIFIDGNWTVNGYLGAMDPESFAYHVEFIKSEKQRSVELITNERFDHYLEILEKGEYKTNVK